MTTGRVRHGRLPEDFDGNGLISVNDVLIVLGDFGCAVCAADLDDDCHGRLRHPVDAVQFGSASDRQSRPNPPTNRRTRSTSPT